MHYVHEASNMQSPAGFKQHSVNSTWSLLIYVVHYVHEASSIQPVVNNDSENSTQALLIHVVLYVQEASSMQSPAGCVSAPGSLEP